MTMGITPTLLNADRITMSNLKTIRHELVPDCNHPKKIMIKLLMDNCIV